MASESEVSVSNAALVSLGAPTINSFEDDNDNARACNALWHIVRRSTIVTSAWACHTKRQELAQSTTTPAYDYTYQYRLPADWLVLRQVYLDTDYKLEGNYVVTNRNTCEVKYIYDNNDVSSWSPHFLEVMVKHMAFRLSYTIPRTFELRNMFKADYEEELMRAQTIDSQQYTADDFGQAGSVFIQNRYGTSGTPGW